MRVGFTFDLKDAVKPEHAAPEDALEEYDSPTTIGYIVKAFEAQGHTVVKLGGGREFLDSVLREKVDIVFNIAEGRGTYRSREAQVPSVLEMLNIPYSGSDPLCLAISLDKALTKQLAAEAGVKTPRWTVVAGDKEIAAVDWNEGYPQ
jgi:D-alanine-D-alanine ligase